MSTTVTIMNFTGFETGDLLEAAISSGTAAALAVDGTVKRTGSYSLKLAPSGLAAAYYMIQQHDATNGAKNLGLATKDIYVTIYLWIDTPPGIAAEEILFMQTTATPVHRVCTLRLTTARKIDLYKYDGGTIMKSGTTVLSTGTWHRLDLRISIVGTTTSVYELKIDGTTEYSGSDGAFGTGSIANCCLGLFSVHNPGAWKVYYDDVSVASDAFVGESWAVTPTVNANGTMTGWSGTYADVDETPHDGDTTYVSTSSATREESVKTASLGVPSASPILAVKRLAIVRSVSSPVSLKFFAYVGGSWDYTSTGTDVGTAYELRGKVDNTDFTTGLDWDTIGANLYEPGVRQDASTAVRCTFLRKSVLYGPAPAVAGAGYAPHGGI